MNSMLLVKINRGDDTRKDIENLQVGRYKRQVEIKNEFKLREVAYSHLREY